MTRTNSLLTTLATCAMLSAPLVANANNAVDDVPACVQRESTQARLIGQGAYRWFGLKIYDARLWAIDPVGRIEDLSTRFSLELQYAQTLYGNKIAEASAEQIQRLGLGNEEQRKQWLSRMLELFPNVREGNRITGVYFPGVGARFCLDDKLLGEVNDPAFARAFFSIWLNDKTSAPALRADLLGRVAR